MQHKTRAGVVSLAVLLVWLVGLGGAWGDEMSNLCADRTAVERVYYRHRLGEKPPFEQVTPPTLIERMVKQELHKEAVLQRVYHVQITSAELESEVQRINSTTRAPDVLAELKSALGNDPARFARTVVKPVLVERLLRQRFENDDAQHARQRNEAEAARAELLKAKAGRADAAELVALLKGTKAGTVSETTWQLTAATAEPVQPNQAESQNRVGPQGQRLSSAPELKLYFGELPAQLQEVLKAQLRSAGDISAVLELPAGFLVYVATGKTPQKLSVATLSIPKQNYEQWLELQ